MASATLSSSSLALSGAVSPPTQPPLLHAAADSASALSGPAVTVEEESTQRCSACLRDRSESEYSSAQLKKKGKRVCHSCVSARDAAASAQKEAADAAAAAARKAAMKDAFASKLNSIPPQSAPSQCPCCKAKAAVRFAPCVRCTVPCCSLRCFDQHDCDAYLEAKRTMPTQLIPEEDRLTAAEIASSWRALVRHLHTAPVRIPQSAEACVQHLEHMLGHSHLMVDNDWTPLDHFYAPTVAAPFWNPSCCARLRQTADWTFFLELSDCVMLIAETAHDIMQTCTTQTSVLSEGAAHLCAMIKGESVARATSEWLSACLLPQRLLHKLLTLSIFITRSLPASWLETQCGSAGQVESDLVGILPYSVANHRIGYVQHADANTGQRTLVPLCDRTHAASKFRVFQQELSFKALMMVAAPDGSVLLDRGLRLLCTSGGLALTAVSGFTGRTEDSFSAAPMETFHMFNAHLESSVGSPAAMIAARQVLEARKRREYFHLILAIRNLVPEEDWPVEPDAVLFIATPQVGIESELVELSLLESLVEEAAAGDKQAQLLLTHIECECSAPIAEVISRQKSRLEQMLEDQADQLRIHAEAVARAEKRARLKAAAAAESAKGASSAVPSASAPRPTSVSAAPAPASAAASASSSAGSSAASSAASSSSSTALSSVTAASAVCEAAAAESAVPYSWTASRAYTSLSDLCTAGRKKYSTITSAALRFLHTLRPVSVNRSGGSHTVFHFASGKPVTLVTPHGGDGTISRHAATRLYAVMHEAALQQFNPTQALQAEAQASGSGSRRQSLPEAAL